MEFIEWVLVLVSFFLGVKPYIRDIKDKKSKGWAKLFLLTFIFTFVAGKIVNQNKIFDLQKRINSPKNSYELTNGAKFEVAPDGSAILHGTDAN